MRLGDELFKCTEDEFEEKMLSVKSEVQELIEDDQFFRETDFKRALVLAKLVRSGIKAEEKALRYFIDGIGKRAYRILKQRKKVTHFIRDLVLAGKWVLHLAIVSVDEMNRNNRLDFLMYSCDLTIIKIGCDNDGDVEILECYLNLDENANNVKSEERKTYLGINDKVKHSKGDEFKKSCFELKQYFDKYMIGQDRYKEFMSVAINMYVHNDKPEPILIIAPTGSGKNYLMKLLEEYEDFKDKVAVVYIDAEEITKEGYTGSKNPSDILSEIALNQKVPGQKVIVFIDEIDKKFEWSGTSHEGENVNKSILTQLMNLISGKTTRNPKTGMEIDTSKVLFVMAGAFEELSELEEKRKKEKLHTIGFKDDNTNIVEESDLREDLITIGGPREFVGRISHIIRMSKLSEKELRTIIIEKIIPQIKNKYIDYGIASEFEDSIVDYAVEKAVREDLGARSAKNTIDSIWQYDIIYKAMEHGADCVKISYEDGVKFEYCRKEKETYEKCS